MKKTRFFLLTFFYFSLIFNLKSFAQKKVYTSTKSASGGWYIHASELKNTTLMVALDDENSLVSKKLIANIEAFGNLLPMNLLKHLKLISI